MVGALLSGLAATIHFVPLDFAQTYIFSLANLGKNAALT